jgi:hypothetical protein
MFHRIATDHEQILFAAPPPAPAGIRRRWAAKPVTGISNAMSDTRGRSCNSRAADMSELEALSRVYHAAFQSAALNPDLIAALKIVNAKIIECVNRSQCTFANGHGAAATNGEQE